MPNAFVSLDTGFPSPGEGESAEKKIDALYGYVYMLLENLRYMLRNLSPENFNETETLDWIGRNIKAETIISNTVITNELYSDYGAIADLTVDRLRTDYVRAQRYLAGNTDPLDYIYIHDEVIDFISATTDGTQTEQLTEGGRTFYWTDGTFSQMTCTETTAYPVMVYVYTELLKGSIRFADLSSGGTVTKIPQLVLGAGYGMADGDRGRGFIRKNTESFDIWLKNEDGELRGLFIGDDYTDITGLRKPTEIDFSAWDQGYFSATWDGGMHSGYLVDFDSSGFPVKITDGAGHETAVIW